MRLSEMNEGSKEKVFLITFSKILALVSRT